MTPKPESETDPWAAMVTLRQLSSERGTPRFDAAFVQECVQLHGWKFCTHCGAPLKVER